LLALADNGGPTQTHALASGSNAINTGLQEFCPDTDQRGTDRDSRCDVGAYEFEDNSGFFVIPLGNRKAVIIPSDG